jgi:hypothetical protein
MHDAGEVRTGNLHGPALSRIAVADMKIPLMVVKQEVGLIRQRVA